MTDDPVLHALLDLCRAVSEHPDSMLEGSPLNAPLVKAMDVVMAHVAPAGELTNVTEHSVSLPQSERAGK